MRARKLWNYRGNRKNKRESDRERYERGGLERPVAEEAGKRTIEETCRENVL